MHWMNLLIILGCLAGGYWLVSSIMGPGVDLTRPKRPAAEKDVVEGTVVKSTLHAHDWHLILDLPANANRREIDLAYKRRLAKAEGAGDSFEAERIRRAYAVATQRPGR
ncbi:MAG: hypothetical protein ABIQ86_07050 [Steroidobacteraceae bacterium]